MSSFVNRKLFSSKDANQNINISIHDDKNKEMNWMKDPKHLAELVRKQFRCRCSPFVLDTRRCC